VLLPSQQKKFLSFLLTDRTACNMIGYCPSVCDAVHCG